jgi:putative colanic acid biosynthesis glycosyltransferase
LQLSPQNKDIVFSIIVVSYNAEQSIASTLQSILTQTFKPIEVIVVDGGSRDQTIEILNQFSSWDNLRWISQPDNGIFDAMNKGVEMANGQYIAFLGADDQLYKHDTLQTVWSEIDGNMDIWVGDIEYTTGKRFTSRISMLIYLTNTMHHQAMIYRREILLKYPFNPDRKFCGDYEKNITMYRDGVTFGKIDQVISRCGADGITHKVYVAASREEADIRKQLFGRFLYPLNVLLVIMKFLVRRCLIYMPRHHF